MLCFFVKNTSGLVESMFELLYMQYFKIFEEFNAMHLLPLRSDTSIKDFYGQN